MRAEELRIGNYVNTKNGIKKVSDIGIDYDCFFTQDHVKPIPLTEEWLLKFGFDKDIDFDNTFNLSLNVLNGFTTITIDVKSNILFLDCMEIKIKYIHQLQNLYFALTNKELSYENKDL